LSLTFFCENNYSKKNLTFDSDENDKKNVLNYLAVKNGTLEKNETLKDFSKEFIAHMLNEFKLTDYLEKKFLGKQKFFLTLILFYRIFLSSNNCILLKNIL